MNSSACQQRDSVKNSTPRAGTGLRHVFEVRENFSDFMFINTFVDQDFIDRHRLFVVGRRLNRPGGYGSTMSKAGTR